MIEMGDLKLLLLLLSHRGNKETRHQKKKKKKKGRETKTLTSIIFTKDSNCLRTGCHLHLIMTARKRNEFLDIPSSEDESGGYDSEAEEETKGLSAKRRRVVEPEESDSEDGEENHEQKDGEEEGEEVKGGIRKLENRQSSSKFPDEKGGDGKEPREDSRQKAKGKRRRQDSKLSKNSKRGKTGVIYLSSLPPYLKPSALKSMLEARGFEPITKVFLTPETPTNSGSRRRSNKRKTYTDGWVEFASKRTAKICAESLNASIVGGRKGGWYHDDVWNMRYLRGFKWADLMEQVQRERAEREATRRVEDSRARKEEKVFLTGVEKGKALDGIQRKNLEKANSGKKKEDEQQEKIRVKRLFRQNEVKVRDNGDEDDGNVQLADNTKRVLGKIF